MISSFHINEWCQRYLMTHIMSILRQGYDYYVLNVRRTLCGGYAKNPQNIHILFRILFEIFLFQLYVFRTQLYFPYTTIRYMFENPYTTICFPYTTICFGAQLSVFRTQLYGFRTQLYGFCTQHIPTLFSVHNYMFETMFETMFVI